MILLEELNEAVEKVNEIVFRIQNEINREVFNKAPIVVHQRFCAELVKVAKEHPNKLPKDVPKLMEILTAISILEEYYPNIKS